MARAHVHPDSMTLRLGAAGISAASLITVAQALGMKVTAEGVESRMQFEILADSRCDRIQGYLTGRPMALTEFERFCALAAEPR